MIFPTIHLNGTSAESLIDDLMKAYSAIERATDALRRATPNGRDYYPQGAEAINVARDEHVSRLRRLRDVQDEIEQIVEAIDHQRDGKAA